MAGGLSAELLEPQVVPMPGLGVAGRLTTRGRARRHAPDGVPTPTSFGNEVGERVGSGKKAWQTAVLKAHGQTPHSVKGKNNQLAPESLGAYRAINLHFHDLRREFGSRVLESGSSLIEARDLLGHANISQISTYLQSTAKARGLAIERKEEHERQLADARGRESEKNSRTATECDNPLPLSAAASESAEVVMH